MSVIERGAEVAWEILERRDADGDTPRDNVFCRLMLAEAYARGFVAGLDQARDAVRIEADACRNELEEDDR